MFVALCTCGRKYERLERDLTEGGIREIGLVEAPWLVKSNREEKTYPMATMDLMASLLDLLQMQSYHNRPLDGHSLVPYLQGKETDRPGSAGIGWYGTFKFGSTDHVNGTFPFYCPNSSAALVRGINALSSRSLHTSGSLLAKKLTADIQELGDLPDNFTTPGHQPQWAWAEGNQYKLFGCVGVFPIVFADYTKIVVRSD